MARPGRKKTNIGPCSEYGCEKDSHTRGYCAAHYQRRKRTGEFSGLRKEVREGNLAPISFAPGVANALSLSTEAARVDALLQLRQ